tara:strand:+ start:267 stop:536 length:270 start_codon:yes stop_codon:yes gene_type:complete
MKSKFKNYLLYTLSTIGVVALFISATTLPPQSSTIPESHVWEMHSTSSNAESFIFAINKKTGEVKQFSAHSVWAKSKEFGRYKLTTPQN